MANGERGEREGGRRAEGAYSGAWLAMKLGVEPRALDVRRRAGELLAVRDETGTDFRYPAWQFGPDGRPLAAVARVVGVAREAGLTDGELADLLQRRNGMTGQQRLLDDVREGREERVLDVIRRGGRS